MRGPPSSFAPVEGERERLLHMSGAPTGARAGGVTPLSITLPRERERERERALGRKAPPARLAAGSSLLNYRARAEEQHSLRTVACKPAQLLLRRKEQSRTLLSGHPGVIRLGQRRLQSLRDPELDPSSNLNESSVNPRNVILSS